MEDIEMDLEIIPNEKEFLEKLEEEMRAREKAELEKIVVEKKAVELKKPPAKEKDCVIF